MAASVTKFSRPPRLQSELLAGIEGRVKAGEVPALEGIYAAIELGYLAIGAAKSRWIYNPADFTQLRKYFDPVYNLYFIPEESYAGVQVIRAFTDAKCALACSLYGNMDQPDRPELKAMLKDVPLPHFGWESNEGTEWRTELNVVPKLQSVTQILGDDLHGAVDMVWNDGSFRLTLDNAHQASRRCHVRQATFYTTGADLPFDVVDVPQIPPESTIANTPPRDYRFL